jgi:hypothetical protein
VKQWRCKPYESNVSHADRDLSIDKQQPWPEQDGLNYAKKTHWSTRLSCTQSGTVLLLELQRGIVIACTIIMLFDELHAFGARTSRCTFLQENRRRWRLAVSCLIKENENIVTQRPRGKNKHEIEFYVTVENTGAQGFPCEGARRAPMAPRDDDDDGITPVVTWKAG